MERPSRVGQGYQGVRNLILATVIFYGIWLQKWGMAWLIVIHSSVNLLNLVMKVQDLAVPILEICQV